MGATEFSQSRLITPARIRADPYEALSILPAWAHSGVILAEDLELSLAQFRVTIQGVQPLDVDLPLLSVAPLAELTRYGNNIVTNLNKRGGDSYAKLTFADYPEDTMPVSRIVMDALPRQAVRRLGGPGELLPGLLEKIGGGKPIKAAREVATGHAADLARKAGDDVGAYLANLQALFDLHDELLFGAFAY